MLRALCGLPLCDCPQLDHGPLPFVCSEVRHSGASDDGGMASPRRNWVSIAALVLVLFATVPFTSALGSNHVGTATVQGVLQRDALDHTESKAPPTTATRNGDGAAFANDQLQLVRQKIYYSSLANFWSTVFMPSLTPGVSQTTGAGGRGGASSSATATVAGTSSEGQSATASSATSAGASQGGPSSSGSSSSAPDNGGVAATSQGAQARHVTPSFIVLSSVVLVAVFVAMLAQYLLRLVEKAVADEMLQYRAALHSVYQQIIAVTLLCGVGFALSNSSFAADLAAGGGAGSELRALLLDVSVFLALTAFVFLGGAMTLVGCAFSSSKRWREWENESRYPDNIVWRYAMSLLKSAGVLDRNLRWYQCGLRKLVDVDVEALGFLLLRAQFVPFVLRTPSLHYRNNRYWYFPRKRDCSALDFHFAHFDFEHYLSHKSGRLLSKLLEIPLSSWLILEFILLLICLPSYASPGLQVVIFVTFGYCVLLAAAALMNYQRNCYLQHVHGSGVWQSLEKRILARSADSKELFWSRPQDDRRRKEGQFKLISDLMAIMMRQSGDGHFVETVEAHHNTTKSPQITKSGVLGCFQKLRTVAAASASCCRPVKPGRRFTFLPHFSVSAARVVLLTTAVYCSILVAAIGAFVLSAPAGALTAISATTAAVLGLAPVPFAVIMVARAMHYTSLLAATGDFRDDSLVADVVASGKAKMTRAALRVLDALILRGFGMTEQGSSSGAASHADSSGGGSEVNSDVANEGDLADDDLEQAGDLGSRLSRRSSRARSVDSGSTMRSGSSEDSGSLASSDSLDHNSPWMLTFDRLARYPFASEVVPGDSYDAMYERRVHWREFLAWYRRWMCRSDIALSERQIFDTFFSDGSRGLKFDDICNRRNNQNATVHTDGSDVELSHPVADWGSLSNRQFQRVFERRREVEQNLRSSVAAIEQLVLRLYDVPADGGPVGGRNSGSLQMFGGQAFLSKRAFLLTTMSQLGLEPIDTAVGATAADLTVQQELASFFDEADPTLEGFVSVSTLSQVLFRYWFWPESQR